MKDLWRHFVVREDHATGKAPAGRDHSFAAYTKKRTQTAARQHTHLFRQSASLPSGRATVFIEPRHKSECARMTGLAAPDRSAAVAAAAAPGAAAASMELEQPTEKPAPAGKLAGKKKQTGCWPCRKEVVEVPLFDDVNCPYPIKPTELFKINEVCPARNPQHTACMCSLQAAAEHAHPCCPAASPCTGQGHGQAAEAGWRDGAGRHAAVARAPGPGPCRQVRPRLHRGAPQGLWRQHHAGHAPEELLHAVL
jgi:hypothetical protein